MQLTGTTANTYTGGTTIDTGVLALNTTTSNFLGAGAIDLQNGGTLRAMNTLVLSNSLTGAGTVIADPTRTLTLSGTVTANLSTQGNVILTGTNSGTTNVQAGSTYTVSNPANSTGTINIANGSTVQFSAGGTSSSPINFPTGGGGSVVNNSGSTLTISGAVNKNGAVASFGGSSPIIISGPITGASANSDLEVFGNLTLTNSNNTYNGPTYVVNGATLTSGVNNAIPATSSVLILGESASVHPTLDTPAFHDTPGTFNLAGFDQTLTGLQTAGTGQALGANANPFVVTSSSGTPTLTINNSSAVSYDGQLTGSLALTKSGAGTLTVAPAYSANNYTGATNVTGGTLALGANNALPTATSLDVSGTGATLDLVGRVQTVGHLSGASTGTVTSSASGGVVTVNNTSGTDTFSGSITGGSNMSFTKSGGGTQVLSGASSYTGATNINGGTLTVASGGSLSATGSVNVNNGGTLAGAGSVGNITINSGATVAPAPGTGSVSAPGNLTAASATLMGGGIFNLQVNDAIGGAGTGWDQLQLNSGTANISSLSSGNQFIVNLQSLTISNTPGTPANFNSAVAYTWDFLNYGTLSGTFASNLFNLNTGAFSGSAGTFSIINNIASTALAVQYTPTVAAVPEPGSLLLTALASLGMAGYGYRRRRRMASEASDENATASNE